MITDQDRPVLRHADAVDVLVRLQTAIKVSKYYAPTNDNFRRQLKALWVRLEKILDDFGEATIQVRTKSIFVNRQRVKFDTATYPASKALLDELAPWGLQTMSLARGLAEGELERLIVLLSRADPREKNPFLALVRGAREAAVTHVRMEPQTEKDSADEAKQAARMYFLGIAHVREIFSGTGAIVNFNVTKRWIQSIFNHLSDDEAFVNGLTNIKNFDEYTFNHSVNVSVLSLAIGRRLNLSPHELSELGLAAFLHDLGKVEIPSEILNKPGRLDAEEKAIMEGHSRLGAQRLLQLKIERGLPNLAIQVALEHHLKPDLGGYPKYQKKRRIALYSKIVKIADVFDALTTKRVYRPKAFTREETLAMMMAKSGDEFDPILLKVFANMIGVYPIGSLVVLSTGEIGVVCEANPQPVFTKRPKVKLITDRAGNMHDGDVVDLTEIDPETRAFARSIVKTLDPEKYGLDVSRFFLARAS